MKTYLIPLGTLSLTIAELSMRHLARIQAEPPTAEKPPLPQGYTHEQAMENVPDYKKLYSSYENMILVGSIYRSVGAARRVAVESKVIPAEEQAALDKLCMLYSFASPDNAETPRRTGELMWDIAEEFASKPGDGVDPLVEAYYWLQLTAGGVSPEMIGEAIKSFRDQRERDAAANSLPDRAGAAEAGVPPANSPSERPVRRGRRSKSVAPKVA